MDTLCLSTTSGSCVSPADVVRSFVAKPSVTPISPPFSEQGFCSSLELGCSHVQSTGEDSMARNLSESVLHLTQGHMIVSYVIADSMVLMSFYLLVCLHLEKKIGAVT